MSKTLEVGKVYSEAHEPMKVEIVAETDAPVYKFIGVYLPTKVHVFAYDANGISVGGNPDFNLIIPQPKKLIDWAKMPIGAETNMGKIIKKIEGDALVVGTAHCFWNSFSLLRLTEQTEFTYWGGVGECPVPDGVVVEMVFRHGTKEKGLCAAYWGWEFEYGDEDIIAYRIIGLAEGYTDNPEEATNE